MRYLASLFFLATLIVGLPAQAQYTEYAISGKFDVTDNIKELNTTMAGTAKHLTRTDRLFAGLQLVSRDAIWNDKIDLGANMRLAPVILPSEIDDSNLKVCADMQTINGLYSGVGELELNLALKTNSQVTTDEKSTLYEALFDTKNTKKVRDYAQGYWLPRAIIAPDCNEEQSHYYVPVSLTDKPDLLVAVFEIGGAAISARMIPADASPNAKSLDLECTTSERVEIGYDCSVSLERVRSNRAPFDVYNLVVTIQRPGMKKSDYQIRFAVR